MGEEALITLLSGLGCKEMVKIIKHLRKMLFKLGEIKSNSDMCV
jgi:hypothetical protein